MKKVIQLNFNFPIKSTTGTGPQATFSLSSKVTFSYGFPDIDGCKSLYRSIFIQPFSFMLVTKFKPATGTDTAYNDEDHNNCWNYDCGDNSSVLILRFCRKN